jgi:two-component system, LytTR family, response regulator
VTLRTLLVDDEPLALDRLVAFFGDIAEAEIVGTARDGREAAEAIRRLKPDLAILDIQMPEQNGLRVAATIAEEDRPEIVFVTAFEQYAPDAFEVDAADYLLKPVRFDRLWQAVERAKRRKHLRALAEQAAARPEQEPTRDQGLWVPTRSGSVFVPMDAIDWIEAQRDYVMLHTATRSHILRISMRALEEKIGGDQLVRVHRSAFARPAQVAEVQRMGRTINALVLRDGAIVPVGPNYAKAVAERLGLPG